MIYTKIYLNRTSTVHPIEEAPGLLSEYNMRVFGFCLLSERAELNKHGLPDRDIGGWSYGLVQNGNICAGAGGANCMPVMPL